MEAAPCGSAPGYSFGNPAYHALTYGWLMSGLARAVTGKGMRELIREELASRWTPTACTWAARPSRRRRVRRRSSCRRALSIIRCSTRWRRGSPRCRCRPDSASMYFPGMKAVVQGDIPLLDAEIPAANGVATARGLARMYGAIANGGRIDGTQFLSRELVGGSDRPAEPAAGPQHLGAAGIPPRLSLGAVRCDAWVRPRRTGRLARLGRSGDRSGVRICAQPAADPRSWSWITPDSSRRAALLRRAAAQARNHGFERVADFGSPFPEPGAVAG